MTQRSSLIPKLVLSAACVVSAQGARAGTVLYSNLYSDDPDHGSNGVIPSGYSPFAASFSTGELLLPELSSVTLSLSGGFYASSRVVTVVLSDDHQTAPGSVIATLGSVSDHELPYYNVQNISFYPDVPFPLLADTRYWIGIVGRTSASWSVAAYARGVGVEGEFMNLGFGASEPNTSTALQMEVVVIPEPSATIIVLLGSALLIVRRRGRNPY